MEQMETWEMILVGMLVAGLLFWLVPGVKRSIESAPKGKPADWMNLAAILGVVVLFVLLLIALV